MNGKQIHVALFTPWGKDPHGRGWRWGAPIVRWGPPGIAKTARWRQTAKQYGLPAYVLSPGARGEGAFGVTPFPVQRDDGTTEMTFPAPSWCREIEPRGLLFIDEMGSIANILQPPMMEALLERQIGGHYLTPTVRVVGAGNPTEMAADGMDLSMTNANRAVHMDEDNVALNDFLAYFYGDGGDDGDVAKPLDAEAEEKRVLATWPTHYSWARGLVGGFLTKLPQMRLQVPAEGAPERSRGWASPRSIESAARLLASCRLHGASESETDEFLVGAVGTAWTVTFRAWANAQDLPDAADLLDGKVKWEPSAARLDRTAAVLGACVSLVAPADAPRREERAVRVWQLFEACVDDAADVVFPNAVAMTRARLAKFAASGKVRVKIQPMLAAAGITVESAGR